MLKKSTLNSLLNLRPFILTSNFAPNDDNINFLSKGPSFTLPNTPSNQVFINYIREFIRKLQWNMLLRKNSTTNRNRFGIKKSNKWISPKLLNQNVIDISNKILYSSIQIIKSSYARENFNVTFIKNNNIKISVADKGSNWVIQSTNSYNNEGYNQLANSDFYKKIEKPRHKHNLAAINRFIDYLFTKKYINLSEKRFLLANKDYHIRNIYFLPKIHKDHWTNPNYQPKGRPIVNCKHSESYQIAIFIDYFLQPLVKISSSYIKDTYHFISKIRNINLKPNSTFVTIDIVSLYTNIPINGAILAIENLFLKNPDSKRPDSVILKLLKIILNNNDFTFNSETYLQTSGVAMGQRFAPSVANIYLANWEDNIKKQFRSFPNIWCRYIDDIFTVWEQDHLSLYNFLDFINNYDEHIKITYEINNESATFLDLSLSKDNCHITHKVHFKDTNSHTILHTSSNHPKHTFKGIIYSQFRRWASLCTTREDFENICASITPIWRQRGYTKTLIRHAKSKMLKHLNLSSIWCHTFQKCFKCPINDFIHECSTYNIIGSNYAIFGNYNCLCTNIIYLIFCDKCQLFYVGQAVNFHQRMLKHIYSIRHNCSILIHRHFWQTCSLSNFKCFLIDSAETITKLKIKESKYIKKFNTIFPYGLNIVENYTPNPTLILPYNKTSFKICSNIKNICSLHNIDMKTVYKEGKSLSEILK